MIDRKKLLGIEDEYPDVQLDAGSVISLVEMLLRIVLAFIPDAENAKGQVDRVAAILANEAAEEAERRKFGF